MRFSWHDYNGDYSELVEGWIDDTARSYTGCDDGFEAFFEYWNNSGEMTYGENFWCKVISAGNRPIGVIALDLYDGVLTVMEYILAPDERNKGYGSAALRELLENGETIIGRRISCAEAVIFPSNVQSQKAFEKAGFRFDRAHPDGDAWYYRYDL